MEKIKRLFFSISSIFLISSLFIVEDQHVYAENGKLTINNEVIYQKEEGQNENGTGTKTIEDLFLKDKSSINDALIKENQEKIAGVKKQVFLNEASQENVSQKENITKKLFLANYETVSTGTTGTKSSSFKFPKWISWIIIAGVIIGMSVLGVILGQKFSKIFVRKRT